MSAFSWGSFGNLARLFGSGSGQRINLKFSRTTLLLMPSGMVAYGTHEVESYLVKSDQLEKETISHPWISFSFKSQNYLMEKINSFILMTSLNVYTRT